ncbi:replication initiation protein [Caballeronia humi]|uniref:replication initiation protein n=1 Tax=Caballeronia humi TaxID=326474 RepID=UPI001F3C1B93|nr:replication initiation protein [Caballeronia humi]
MASRFDPVPIWSAEEFTTYKLKHAAALRSIYSWRLFECLMSWDGLSRWTPTIEEFQNAIDAKPNQRAHFKELRRRVIEPAVEELREARPACRWAPVKGEGMNDNEDKAVILRIYRLPSGLWGGRRVVGDNDIGELGAFPSMMEVEDAAGETGLYPDLHRDREGLDCGSAAPSCAPFAVPPPACRTLASRQRGPLHHRECTTTPLRYLSPCR